jgi:hypothetical protein
MSKLISYSLFSHPSAESFERLTYIRGAYWNFRMNNLIFPDWRSHLEVDNETYLEFNELFDWLVENNNLSLQVNEHNPELCASMLWRMKPIWTIDVSHVLCRDADAITTYKEAQYIQYWLERGVAVCSIHDNPAHGGLMGGMVGFDTAAFKALTQINSFDELISNHDLSQRGSDQHLLNGEILPKVKNDLCTYNGLTPLIKQLPLVSDRLWESNLCCRHIGSAGVVEMETIRFFKRFDIYQWKFDVIEKQFPKLFYWHL